ncbi:enoyl-CoA hydratase/isomerase family protein [Mariniluteicoccus flavus]
MELAYAPGTHGTDEVLFATGDGLGHVLLNRPKAINSLTTAMCRSMFTELERWADDDTVGAVVIRGAGERGLCAGGDVKAVRQAIVDDPGTTAPMEFFETEYRLNQLIAEYPKPYVAVMDGVCMGGGLGVSAHGSHRLVTERSKLAMPETIIGFFPDVGMTHLLAHAPGEFGTMLALTGRTIGAGDAIAAGLADTVASDPEAYARAVAEGAEGRREPVPAPELAGASWIDECFSGDSATDIVARLAAHPDPAANEAADQIAQRSPLSVAVTLRAVREAALMSVEEVLAQDLRLADHFRREPDFLEGVRCQLVDRGDTPTWRHASLAEVSDAEVEGFWG